MGRRSLRGVANLGIRLNLRLVPLDLRVLNSMKSMSSMRTLRRTFAAAE